MADDAKAAGREPWWARTRAAEDEGPDEGQGAPRPPAGGAPWLGQTEPFLRALERSLEPLEERLARISDAARANHTEMERLGGETHEGLTAVTEALAEARSAFTASADAVRARADATAALIEGAGAEVERLAGLLAEAEERTTAAGAANRAAVEERVASAVEQLNASLATTVGEAEGRLAEGHASAAESAARTASEATGTRVAAAVEELTASLRAAVGEAEGRLAEGQATAAGSLERAATEIERLTGALAETEQRADTARTADREAVVEHLRESAASLRESIAEGQAAATGSLERTIAEATEGAAGRAVAATEQVGTQVEAVRGSVERLPTREDVAAARAATAALEGVVRESDAALAEHVTASSGELDTKLRTALRDTADESAAQTAMLQARVDSVGERLPVLLDGVRDELAAHHDRSAAQLAEQVSASVAALDQGLKRVERLGDLIEAMATKRGFQELVQSETALREEQAAFVAGLTDASKHVEEQVAVVTGRADDLAQRLEAAARDAAALREVPPRAAELVAGTMSEAGDSLGKSLRSQFAEDVARTTAELRRELEAGVPVAEVLERLERLAGTQAEVTAAHDEVTAVAGTVGEAADELRRRMDGWGEARSAPHLAEELAALEERVRRIEQYVADDLAAALSELVSKQVVEALDEREAERPKGIFRRT